MTSDEPTTVDETEKLEGKKSKKRFWMFGCLGCSGVILIVIAVFALLIYKAANRPTAFVQTGLSMPQDDLQAIRDAGLLPDDEEILHICSRAIPNFLSHGFFYTSKRVVIYGDLNDPAERYSALLERVVDITMTPSDVYYTPSEFVITLDDGNIMEGCVTIIAGGDHVFYEGIMEAWGKATGEP